MAIPHEQVMIVVGGHLNDPGQIQGTIKCADPTTMNPDNWDIGLMPFVLLTSPATQDSLQRNPQPPEPGSMVLVRRHDKDNPSTAYVVSTIGAAENFGDNAEPGNMNLKGWDYVKKFLTGKNIPGIAKEVIERGAKVRDIDKGEKGREHSFELTKGLPVHLALSSLMGQIIPQNRKIDTAIEQFIGIPTSAMLSQLPGVSMSLSSLLSKLTKKQFGQATKNMSPDLLTSFNSLAYLITDVQTEAASMIGNRVHEETFIANAIELLQQARSTSDILTIFDRLRYDTTLFGLDKLANVEFKSNTAYGQIVMTLDSLGNLVLDSNSQNLLATAASTLTGAMGGSQGGDPDKNLFGDAGQNMQKALERLAGSGEEFRNKLIREVVQKTKQFKHDACHKQNCGGFPLKVFHG